MSDSVEEYLVDILVDPIKLKIQTNYIKTLWLLNKEPELEELVKFLEQMDVLIRTKKAKESDQRKNKEERDYLEGQKYAEHQQLMEQMERAQHIHNPNIWTTAIGNPDYSPRGITTTINTGTTTAIKEKSKAAKYWDKYKGSFDPPF